VPPPAALYTRSLHDALPIWDTHTHREECGDAGDQDGAESDLAKLRVTGSDETECFASALQQFAHGLLPQGIYGLPRVGDEQRLRSEEHTSELQSRENLVCRL